MLPPVLLVFRPISCEAVIDPTDDVEEEVEALEPAVGNGSLLAPGLGVRR